MLLHPTQECIHDLSLLSSPPNLIKMPLIFEIHATFQLCFHEFTLSSIVRSKYAAYTTVVISYYFQKGHA